VVSITNLFGTIQFFFNLYPVSLLFHRASFNNRHKVWQRTQKPVTSVKNKLWLPDDGPWEVRNMLECILEF
jgi:hypothetical protein